MICLIFTIAIAILFLKLIRVIGRLTRLKVLARMLEIAVSSAHLNHLWRGTFRLKTLMEKCDP